MYSTYIFKSKDKEHAFKVKQRFHESLSICEQVRTPFVDCVHGETKEILLEGVRIHYINSQTQSPIEVDVTHSFPFLKLHFEIEGRSEYRSTINPNEYVIIAGGCYNFFYLPKVNGTLTYPTSNRRSLEITFTEKFLKSIFKNHWHSISGDFGEAIRNKKSYKMHADCAKIPSSLLVMINEVIHCTYQKEIKEVYLISKITEMLSYLFTEIKRKKHISENKKPLKKSEFEDILWAEKILQENFKSPPTIKELSIETGINQCKLKTNFKKVFHQPIFQYITQIRMEKAKQMLIEQDDVTIAEIAYTVGYRNPQHFTVAFKKKYNYLPSDLRKKFH